MILLEKEIEKALRAAIRTSLNTFGVSVPELMDCKILTFWLPSETGGDESDYDGLRVEIKAMPNSSGGWIAGVGFEPIRSVAVSIEGIVQPDSDKDKRITNALYEAVRTPFETSGSFTFPAGINFGGMQIAGGGNADMENVGRVFGLTIKMDVSL